LLKNEYHNTVSRIKKYLNEMNIFIDKFYLFGSRARNDFNLDSDFDFMIVVKNELNIAEKRKLTANIYRKLIQTKELILMDLIIKTSSKFYQECVEPGYLAYTVFNEGIEI